MTYYVRALIFNSSRRQLFYCRANPWDYIFHTELIMLYSVVPRFSLYTDYNIIHGCCQYFAPVMQAHPFLSVCTCNCSWRLLHMRESSYAFLASLQIYACTFRCSSYALFLTVYIFECIIARSPQSSFEGVFTPFSLRHNLLRDCFSSPSALSDYIPSAGYSIVKVQMAQKIAIGSEPINRLLQ